MAFKFYGIAPYFHFLTVDGKDYNLFSSFPTFCLSLDKTSAVLSCIRSTLFKHIELRSLALIWVLTLSLFLSIRKTLGLFEGACRKDEMETLLN